MSFKKVSFKSRLFYPRKSRYTRLYPVHQFGQVVYLNSTRLRDLEAATAFLRKTR
jgi:hypothetical protein